MAGNVKTDKISENTSGAGITVANTLIVGKAAAAIGDPAGLRYINRTTIPTDRVDGDAIRYKGDMYIYDSGLAKFIGWERHMVTWGRDTQSLSNSWVYSGYSMAAGADDEGQHPFPDNAVIIGIRIKLRMGGTGGDDGLRRFEVWSKLESVPDIGDTNLLNVEFDFTAANDGWYADDGLNISVTKNHMAGIYIDTSDDPIAGNDPKIHLIYKWLAV